MIIATMILILAALVVVVIGFIMDRLAIRKIKSGLRSIHKRVKTLEKQSNLYNISFCSEDIAKAGRDYISKTSIEEEVSYEAVDPEQEKENDSPSTDSPDGEV